jgi:hypothetical protein
MEIERKFLISQLPDLRLADLDRDTLKDLLGEHS